MIQFDVKRVQKGTESFMVSFDFTKTPVTQVADYIIIAASQHKTSDIHFDPREDGMMVRFRIDGDLQDYTFVPKAYEKNLTTRLKLLANMNITESRLPQDGAIKGEFGGKYLDMRVSALPLNEGEKIVIRILDFERSMQGIDSLGFHPENLKKIKRMMDIPNGIILTTGATGSGKSTTTYSILQALNTTERNIITVEDPIEMNIEGINQVQVNAEIGMTFAAALRSILRQDPNIILIGEIRDSETAQIAVRSAITGHLVLSTIHTNNALATVERLLDMNVERYLLSTALTGIVSQRLGKMLCTDCRFQRETTPYEKKVFKKFMHRDVPMIWDANPKGCDNCRSGYRGRIAFHEVLEIDDEIRNALNQENLSKKELAKLVYTNKTITMLQDALIKCLEGKTSFEEVYRNIEIETEDDDSYEEEIGEFLEKVAPKTPEMEDEEESDDLLGTTNKDDSNNISNMIAPPAFSAADFSDEQTENTPNVEKNDESSNNNTAEQNQPTQQVTQPTQQVQQAQTTQQVQTTQQTVQPQQVQATQQNVPQQVAAPTTQTMQTTPQQVSQPTTTIPQQQIQPATTGAYQINQAPQTQVMPQQQVQGISSSNANIAGAVQVSQQPINTPSTYQNVAYSNAAYSSTAYSNPAYTYTQPQTSSVVPTTSIQQTPTSNIQKLDTSPLNPTVK